MTDFEGDMLGELLNEVVCDCELLSRVDVWVCEGVLEKVTAPEKEGVLLRGTPLHGTWVWLHSTSAHSHEGGGEMY